MVPRVQRKAAAKKSAKKAKNAKKASGKAQQKKAKKKAATKAAKKAPSKPAPKAGSKAATKSAPVARKTAGSDGVGAKRVPRPISKPPKLDMNSDVMEFIAAIDAYRQEYHRPFPRLERDPVRGEEPGLHEERRLASVPCQARYDNYTSHRNTTAPSRMRYQANGTKVWFCRKRTKGFTTTRALKKLATVAIRNSSRGASPRPCCQSS